jgi:gamma-glutamylcysteine synthetase
MEVLLGCGAGWLSSRFNFNWSIEKTRCWRIAFFYRDKEGILDHTFYDLIVPVPISVPISNIVPVPISLPHFRPTELRLLFFKKAVLL